jgi:hypothetical protein
VLPPLISDLVWYVGIFLVAWFIYFAAHIATAQLGLVTGAGISTVVVGVSSALMSGVLARLVLQAKFSSSSVGDLASIVAPISFLGFWSIWLLLGPIGVDRSITVTILSAFKSVEAKTLSAEQLMKAVPFDRIYNKRIQEMSRVGVIELTRNGARVTQKGTRILQCYLWLGRLLRVEAQ